MKTINGAMFDGVVRVSTRARGRARCDGDDEGDARFEIWFSKARCPNSHRASSRDVFAREDDRGGRGRRWVVFLHVARRRAMRARRVARDEAMTMTRESR